MICIALNLNLNNFQVFVVFSLLVASISANPLPDHLPHGPVAHHGPTRPYNFAYGVQDKTAYGHPLDFGHTEGRTGYNTQGSYHVLLPDGRTQTVTYHVDDAHSGYIADVQYSGKAAYAPAHRF